MTDCNLACRLSQIITQGPSKVFQEAYDVDLRVQEIKTIKSKQKNRKGKLYCLDTK